MDADAIRELTTALKDAVTVPGRTTVTASAVAVKLPALWIHDPKLWFVRADAQFAAAKITSDETKFNHVVSILDDAAAKEISSLLLNPPDTDKYKAVRDALISVYDKPQELKDAELLNLAGLGDRTPSGLLRHMRALEGRTETLFRALWLSQLPAHVRTPLATSAETDIDKLAIVADKVFLAGQQAEASKVHSVTPRHTDSDQINAATAVSNDVFICRYHRRFGMKARSCKQGCAFAKCPKPHKPAGSKPQRHASRNTLQPDSEEGNDYANHL